ILLLVDYKQLHRVWETPDLWLYKEMIVSLSLALFFRIQLFYFYSHMYGEHFFSLSHCHFIHFKPQ
ncbi:MAG: hypothetical protein ACTH5M_00235, partial [Psychrobacter sp.]